MCFIFTCGETEFSKQLQGYEHVTCQCRNCGNWSGHVKKRNPWFTFCFIPIIPLSIKGYTDIVCHICRASEALENRPDVQAMRGSSGTPMQPSPNGPQGWNNGPPGGGGHPQPGPYGGPGTPGPQQGYTGSPMPGGKA